MLRHAFGAEGSDMCPPYVEVTIGPDVFIGCPEGSVIGGIEHCRAVIPYPKIDEEKAATRRAAAKGRLLPVADIRVVFPCFIAPTCAGAADLKLTI